MLVSKEMTTSHRLNPFAYNSSRSDGSPMVVDMLTRPVVFDGSPMQGIVSYGSYVAAPILSTIDGYVSSLYIGVYI